MERWPLFVFGTLRMGQRNHHLLRGRYERRLPAVLHGFTQNEPLMIVREPGGHVEGELYHLHPHRYEETLAGCDKLEGIPPGEMSGPEYKRLTVQVETSDGTQTAWAYVHPETTA